jgi:hypothetical protein
MTAGDWMLLLVGMIPGFYVGRWSAERGRARYDGKRAWNQRQNYRRED